MGDKSPESVCLSVHAPVRLSVSALTAEQSVSPLTLSPFAGDVELYEWSLRAIPFEILREADWRQNIKM